MIFNRICYDFSEPLTSTIPNYLCFTALQANSTISYGFDSGDYVLADIVTRSKNYKYSFDCETWNTFTTTYYDDEECEIVPSTVITLQNIGDKVYFKGNNTGNNGTGIDCLDGIYHFTMSGLIAASGCVSSLLSESMNNNNLRFPGLFYNCTALTTPPQLPLNANINDDSCSSMFEGCINLTAIPEISFIPFDEDPEIPEIYTFSGMFEGCSSLNIYTSSSSSHSYQFSMSDVYLGTYEVDYPCAFGNMFKNCGGDAPATPIDYETVRSFTYYVENEPVPTYDLSTFVAPEEPPASEDGKTFATAITAYADGTLYTSTITSDNYSYNEQHIALFKFIPQKTQFYYIRCGEEYGDTYGYLFNDKYEYITENDDGGDDGSFCITESLTAGSTYYIGAAYYDDDGSSIGITIEGEEE